MSRLVLVTGAGGSGVSTLAAATAAAAVEEGLSARLLTVEDSGAAHPMVGTLLSATIGQTYLGLGADRVVPEAWSRLSDVRLLSTLARAADAVAEHACVVVDAGPSATARDLVALPDLLVRLLDAAMTPRMAMARGADGSATTFEALSTARAEALRLRALVHRPDTTLRLVVPPTPVGLDHVDRWLGAFALLGVGVDGVAVNRYPRKAEGGAAEAADLLARIRRRASGVTVWKSTTRLRAVPKGVSVAGPLGRVAVLDADQLTVHVGDEDLHLVLPLAGRSLLEATVGVEDDRLILATDDVQRWVDLPPVLRRCQPRRAVRTGDGLRIEFTPDPATWMRRSGEETP